MLDSFLYFQMYFIKPALTNTKTRQRKLQANIPDEHRCKNPQQDNQKQSSIKR